MINSPTTGTLTANAVAGAIVVILGFLLQLAHPAIMLPPYVQTALALVIGWLLSFAIHNPDSAQNNINAAAQKGFGRYLTCWVLAAFGLICVLAACNSMGKFDPKHMDPKVTEEKALADLQWACLTLNGAAMAWNAVAPAVKQSVEGANNTSAALAGINGLCGGAAPPDLATAYQKVMDATGQVSATLRAAKAGPAVISTTTPG